MESALHFSSERFELLRETYRKWWDGSLDRPIVPIITGGHPSRLDPTRYPTLSFETAWDDSIAPELFVEQQNAALSTMRFHGDAFPSAASTPFGAGALAALLGCKPISSRHTVWFLPNEKDVPIEALHFEYSEDTPAFRRIMRYYEAAVAKWQGNVVINMFDLGGVMDVLASFRGTENLLMDLLDAPEEVLRCIREIQSLWLRYFKRFTDVIAPTAPGFSHWYGMYSDKPSYILQSDFSYMISPKMFDAFVAPELADTAAQMHNALYHMDGVGQIPHLDSLLKIDAIKGIQWVPGDGEAFCKNWDELHLKILNAGKKLISLVPAPDGAIDPVYRQSLRQLYFPFQHYHADALEQVKAFADRYGVEVRTD